MYEVYKKAAVDLLCMCYRSNIISGLKFFNLGQFPLSPNPNS